MAKVSLEHRLLLDGYGKWLWVMRRQPSHAAYWLTGVKLPPHERMWMAVYFGDTKENNVVASRGTSKSFTHASLAAPLKGLLFRNITLTTLSASGFRGSKELFKDAARMFEGQLKSQNPPGSFLLASTKDGKRVISRDPSMWEIMLRSGSRYNCAPTNNPDQLRGLRTNELLIDERNTFDGTVVQAILRPLLNVGQDFEKTASAGDNNKIYQVSTIDFTIRDWYPELQNAEQQQKRQYAAMQALKNKDWEEYDRLMNDKDGELRDLSFSYTKVDYTDLLIPEYVTTLDGDTRYRIDYPLASGVARKDILRFDKQDRTSYWYTYPVDKKGLEQPRRDGTVDEDLWLAEQRNCFISASGNVFDFDLIQRISERPVWTAKEAPKSKRKRQNEEEDDQSLEEYYAPLLYSCGDPCVLAIDVARESDEIAFVVIRLGELAEGDFDALVPRMDKLGRPMLGKTDWNHVCWAESHRKLQAFEVAKIIRDLYARFNLVKTETLPGMGMDKKGGGSYVRDPLANPQPEVHDGVVDASFDFKKIVKIFDPNDDDEGGFAHFSAYNDPMYWGGLRLISAQNQDNSDWTFATRGLMQQKRLYLGFWQPPSRWCYEKGILNPNGEPDKLHPEYQKWIIGYNGIRRLKMQLLRIQQKVSEQGVIRFQMPGDKSKEEGKKDLYVALTYAVSIAHEHLVAQTKEDDEAPEVEPLFVQFGMNGAQWGV